MDIQFLFFEGCPNSASTLGNLTRAIGELGFDVEPMMILVDSPDRAVELRFLRSPSIYVDGVDLVTGIVPESGEFACRVYDVGGKRTGVLPVELIKAKLQERTQMSQRPLDS